MCKVRFLESHHETLDNDLFFSCFGFGIKFKALLPQDEEALLHLSPFIVRCYYDYYYLLCFSSHKKQKGDRTVRFYA